MVDWILAIVPLAVVTYCSAHQFAITAGRYFRLPNFPSRCLVLGRGTLHRHFHLWGKNRNRGKIKLNYAISRILMSKRMTPKVILQFSPSMANSQQHKAKCGTSTLARVCSVLFDPSVQSRARQQQEGGATRRRGATRVRDAHGFLMKVCLMDRGERTCERKKKNYRAGAKQPLREQNSSDVMRRVEFFPPPHVKMFYQVVRGSSSQVTRAPPKHQHQQ